MIYINLLCKVFRFLLDQWKELRKICDKNSSSVGVTDFAIYIDLPKQIGMKFLCFQNFSNL